MKALTKQEKQAIEAEIEELQEKWFESEEPETSALDMELVVLHKKLGLLQPERIRKGKKMNKEEKKRIYAQCVEKDTRKGGVSFTSFAMATAVLFTTGHWVAACSIIAFYITAGCLNEWYVDKYAGQKDKDED